MATIPRYTKTVIRPRATPNTVDPGAIGRAAAPYEAAAQVSGATADLIQQREDKKQTRYETIQRARALSGYKNELENDFMKFETESDLTDPNAPRQFNQTVRKKMAEYLANHDGGEASKADLELQLTGLADAYSLKMTQTSKSAQQKFITNQMGTHIDRIAGEAYQNPRNIDISFKQLSGLMSEYAPAIDSVQEMEMLEGAQSMIVESALNSYIDDGDYEGAQNLITENDRFIQSMPVAKQMSLLGKVNNGLRAQEREQNELTNKMRALERAAQMAGVEISKAQIFSAATGISESEAPNVKVQKFQSLAGLSDNQMTPEIIAKIGFGVDLPAKGEIDMNKERLPDGGYTPKGIGVVIKPAYEAAASAKINIEKVLLQADEFLNTENSQAGLASMIAFQKLIDEGAAVREGDIQLSAQGNSALDNLKLMMDRVEKGAIATPKQIQEMKVSAEIFGQSVMEASKTFIDPYLQEASERGYRMLDIGIPQNSYDRIFKNVKTAEDENKRNTEIETKAKNYGMSVNEYLTSTAQKNNMSVEEVAKRLGYTGKVQ